MTEVDGKLERCLAKDHRPVEVARRHREGTHDRFALVSPLRLGQLVPGQPAGALEYQ
jgi:hypothetical protein